MYKIYCTSSNYVVKDTKRVGFSSIVFDGDVHSYIGFLDWMEMSIIIKAHSGDVKRSVHTVRLRQQH